MGQKRKGFLADWPDWIKEKYDPFKKWEILKGGKNKISSFFHYFGLTFILKSLQSLKI